MTSMQHDDPAEPGDSPASTYLAEVSQTSTSHLPPSQMIKEIQGLRRHLSPARSFRTGSCDGAVFSDSRSPPLSSSPSALDLVADGHLRLLRAGQVAPGHLASLEGGQDLIPLE